MPLLFHGRPLFTIRYILKNPSLLYGRGLENFLIFSSAAPELSCSNRIQLELEDFQLGSALEKFFDNSHCTEKQLLKRARLASK